MTRGYRFISADSHFEVPCDRWTARVPAQYRDRAPRRIRLANGADAILAEGRPVIYGGTGQFAGKSAETFTPVGLDYERSAGTGPPEQRLREQDADGIDAELLYPGDSSGAGHGLRNIRDRAAYVAINRAYNEYLALDYCAAAPDRLFGVGILPQSGVDDALQEVHHCVKLGLRAVALGTFPSGKEFPTPEDDRFWAAVVDHDIALTIHTSFPRRPAGRDVPLFRYPLQPEGEERPPVDFVERMARHSIHHCGSLEAVQMVLAGVFDRFPRLQVYWAENNMGWIPYFYDQMDLSYKVNAHWAERLLGLPILKRLPSEYLREHAYWGFWDDPMGARVYREVGVDRLMWGNDFPHIVTRWPHSLEVFNEQFGEAPEADRYQLTAGNCMRFLRLEAARG